MSCFAHSLFRLTALCLVAWSLPAHAILAGDPAGTPVDAPALREDPNTVTSPWAGVGNIAVGDKSFSAALISPRHVITAAHVVNGAKPENVTFILNAGGVASHRLAAGVIYVNPGYQGFVPSADGIVHDDLAIVELAEAAPADIPYYTPYFGELVPGTPLTLVGYGATGDGVHGVTGNKANTKRTGRNAADVFALDDDGSDRIEAFLFDFDGPDAASNRFGGTTLGNNVETTLAGGDSGSPALLKINGAWQLAGVSTFVSHFKDGPTQPGVFGTGGGGMVVSGYAEWMMQTQALVRPVSPVPEPAPVARWLPGLLLLGLIASRRKG